MVWFITHDVVYVLFWVRESAPGLLLHPLGTWRKVLSLTIRNLAIKGKIWIKYVASQKDKINKLWPFNYNLMFVGIAERPQTHVWVKWEAQINSLNWTYWTKSSPTLTVRSGRHPWTPRHRKTFCSKVAVDLIVSVLCLSESFTKKLRERRRLVRH